VREPGRLTAHDSQTRTAIATGNQFFDATVVETSARRAPILHEYLGKVTSIAQGAIEGRLQHRLFHQGLAHVSIVSAMTLAPGLTASVTLVVAEADTALALRSGDVPVLGTPRVIALAEQASCEAIASELPEGRTTVGYQVQLAHLTPTAVGSTVVAEATLEQIEGRRLTFRVSVNDARGLVAAGRITRVVVERARFLERAQSED
jgi:predicted thioesterase